MNYSLAIGLQCFIEFSAGALLCGWFERGGFAVSVFFGFHVHGVLLIDIGTDLELALFANDHDRCLGLGGGVFPFPDIDLQKDTIPRRSHGQPL